MIRTPADAVALVRRMIDDAANRCRDGKFDPESIWINRLSCWTEVERALEAAIAATPPASPSAPDLSMIDWTLVAARLASWEKVMYFRASYEYSPPALKLMGNLMKSAVEEYIQSPASPWMPMETAPAPPPTQATTQEA